MMMMNRTMNNVISMFAVGSWATACTAPEELIAASTEGADSGSETNKGKKRPQASGGDDEADDGESASTGGAEPMATSGPSSTGTVSVGTTGTTTGTSTTTVGVTTDAGDSSDEGGLTGGPVEPPDRPPLDCGPIGEAIVDAGPVENRVNYVIIGDGYTADEVETTFLEDVEFSMVKRFDPIIGEPYLRYRNFVNICAIKLPSPGPICSNSALGCCGDDQSRLARCNNDVANQALADNLPPGFEIDWKAVVLNGDSWWNTGSVLMLWSGGHNDADGAALHEGGHGFHQLADEYAGTSTSGCTDERREVNSTADGTQAGGKWDRWYDFVQEPGTGVQGAFEGSRYCDNGQFRPSDNSMMNSLFGDDPDTAFNPVSREKMIMDIWRVVEPVDAVEPPAGVVADATRLVVHVIDPEVISIDWVVDDELVASDGGAAFDVTGLSSGTHTIQAFAYDNAGEEWVRYREGGEWGRENWARSQQTIEWTVTVP